jgi:hypothetical protein
MQGKRTLLVILVILLLCFTLGQHTQVSSSNAPPRHNQQLSHGCGYGCQTAVDPVSPTEGNHILITAGGEWYDSCIPTYQSHQIVGNVVVVDAAVLVPPGTACLDVVTSWSIDAHLGRLPPGSYQTELYITDTDPDFGTELCSTGAFTVSASSSSDVLLTALYYGTYLPGEPDEAFRLTNASAAAIDLADWTATDLEGTVTLTGTLDASQAIWVAREADAFAEEFGFPPDYEYGADTDPAVPNLPLTGSLSLANAGDQLVLRNHSGAICDSVVYEGASTAGTDWSGTPVEPYSQGCFTRSLSRPNGDLQFGVRLRNRCSPAGFAHRGHTF